MRESVIEAYFVRRVKEAGGQQRKQVGLQRGLPDRYAGFPGARFAFVELKAPGKLAKPHQARELARWQKLGFHVFVIDSKEAVDVFIEFMMR